MRCPCFIDTAEGEQRTNQFAEEMKDAFLLLAEDYDISCEAALDYCAARTFLAIVALLATGGGVPPDAPQRILDRSRAILPLVNQWVEGGAEADGRTRQ